MNDAADINAAVGRNLAAIRASRQLTLDRLAKISGVSKGMLVQIEHGRTNPSIATLCRIANAFGISVSRLMDGADSVGMSKTSLEDGTTLWRGSAGGLGRLITGFEDPTLLEFWEWEFNPGESHDGIAHPSGTKELLFVQQGVLTVTAGESSDSIGANEALVFGADVPHRYSNDGKARVVFLMIITEPGAQRQERKVSNSES